MNPQKITKVISGDEIRARQVGELATIAEAASAMDRARADLLIMIDSKGQPVGTISDDELRAAIVRNLSQSDSALRIAQRDFAILRNRDDFDANAAEVAVVVGADGKPVEICIATDPRDDAPLRALVFAGGLGTRMGSLTNDTPKPLISVAGEPLINHVLRLLARHRVENVSIATNYLAQQIEDYVGCGARYGLSIQYLREERRLGTAGAVSLLDPAPAEPFLVLNADIITKLNLRAMVRRHRRAGAAITIAVAPYTVECPFGVAKLNDTEVIELVEKPRYKHWVNAGIYVISPSVVANVPRNTYIDMTTMIQRLIQEGDRIEAFPIREYWHDAGTPGDLERVSSDLAKH